MKDPMPDIAYITSNLEELLRQIDQAAEDIHTAIMKANMQEAAKKAALLQGLARATYTLNRGSQGYEASGHIPYPDEAPRSLTQSIRDAFPR